MSEDFREFSYYDPDTGHFTGTRVRVSPSQEPPTHRRWARMPGRFDHLSQRVDLATGEVVDFVPPQPSSDHEWDAEKKRWNLNADAAARKRDADAALLMLGEQDRRSVRALREALLEALARIDALESAGTGPASRSTAREKLAALDESAASFRQKLRGDE